MDSNSGRDGFDVAALNVARRHSTLLNSDRAILVLGRRGSDTDPVHTVVRSRDYIICGWGFEGINTDPNSIAFLSLN